jgi:tetraacyldisaccharide 4'-kinase
VTSASQFRDLVSGRRRGLSGALARAALALAEIPYAAAVGWRNRRFDRGSGVERVSVPVVSVGNLTLGGTGKTPLVEWLARWFADRGVRVALVSRGYGAKPGQPNDEALELARSLPQVPHLQNPHRVQAAAQAVRDFGAQLILLDDGFQHRRLARDLDIVLVDALEPFGFGRVFPRGTLREPLSGFRRAQVVALSRSDLVSAEERNRIRREVERHAPQAAWVELCTRPRGLCNHSGAERAVASLANERVAAFCGIGNPAGFRHQLAGCGCSVATFREFADHQTYSPSDVESLSAWLAGQDVSSVVCTRKDLVKLPFDVLGATPLWALAIDLEVRTGQAELLALLEPLIQRALGALSAC